MTDPARYYVVISESALQDMLVTGLESALIRPLGSRIEKNKEWEGYEIDGHIWGHHSQNDECQFYTINKMSVSVSSKRTPNMVMPSARTLGIQQKVLQSIWPEMSLIGHFHTHPYINLSEDEISKEQYYFESPGDIEFMRENDEFKVYVIMTITRRITDFYFPDYPLFEKGDYSVITFCIGDLVIWMSARVRRKEAINMASRKKVFINCPSVTGLSSPEAYAREKLKFLKRKPSIS